MFWSLEQDIINFLLSYLLKFCLRSTFSFNLGLTASLTLEGGGGWVILEKKIPASTCWEKKIACSTKKREKNSCTATSKEKML